jgi:acyl-homoserine lactone synthase
MIDVIGPWNRSHHRATLDAMFRLRHHVFVEELQWDLPLAQGGMERDEFDGPRAVYLVCRNPRGGIAGSMRMIPTTEPHLLADVFPHLCKGPVPRGPTIFESSRSCIAPGSRGREELGRVWGELTCAMLEYSMLREADAITAVMETRMVKTMCDVDWAPTILGETVVLRGAPIVGISAPVDTRALANLRRQRQVPDPVLAIRFESAAMAA